MKGYGSFSAPNFVATFVYKEHVYFWFREVASEAIDNNEESQVGSFR